MSRHLLITEGPERGQTHRLRPGQTLTVGRAREAQIRIADLGVSRLHCRLEVSKDRLLVRDLGSAGGTFINQERVQEGMLGIGDSLRIGQTVLQLVHGDLADHPTIVPEPEPDDATDDHENHSPATPVNALPTVDPSLPIEALTGLPFAHFDVKTVLSTGQQGIVFGAVDRRNGKYIALKVMRPPFASRRDDLMRFVRAMKTVMPLRHPNLISLLGAGKTGPFCWIAMEYIDGESLTQVIQRIGVAGMLDWRIAVRVAVHLARALDFAHQAHIIHRNLTPQNVLIRVEDRVTLLGDLMLAKATEGQLSRDVTRPGEIVGDIRYMSPERLTGGEVDARSDLYSLGALVYALLTGRPPFEGDTLIETIGLIQKGEPLKPKKFQMSISDLFEGIILQLLAKRPHDRIQTAADLLEALARVAKFQGVKVD